MLLYFIIYIHRRVDATAEQTSAAVPYVVLYPFGEGKRKHVPDQKVSTTQGLTASCRAMGAPTTLPKKIEQEHH